MPSETPPKIHTAVARLLPGEAADVLQSNHPTTLHPAALPLLRRRAARDAGLGVTEPLAGLVAIRRTAAGTVVGLYDSRESDGNPDPESRWRLVCEGPDRVGASTVHGGICGWPTRRAAESYLAHPGEWCPVCQERYSE